MHKWMLLWRQVLCAFSRITHWGPAKFPPTPAWTAPGARDPGQTGLPRLSNQSFQVGRIHPRTFRLVSGNSFP
jgi:hypothetical protein